MRIHNVVNVAGQAHGNSVIGISRALPPRRLFLSHHCRSAGRLAQGAADILASFA